VQVNGGLFWLEINGNVLAVVGLQEKMAFYWKLTTSFLALKEALMTSSIYKPSVKNVILVKATKIVQDYDPVILRDRLLMGYVLGDRGMLRLN
jgi:hypothetical protein